MKISHLISTKQFDRKSLESFFESVKKMEKGLEDGSVSALMKNKIMATLFFEPSTRTRFSFETAMLRLGGSVISNADMLSTSSSKKMESLEDTGKVVSQMVDIIAVRHPEAGSVEKIANYSDVPVINAGDGSNQHPTQALLDVYTIWKHFGKLDGIKVGMVGDLKNGRVPHSQCDLLSLFDVNFVFVSPEGLNMPEDIVNNLMSEGKNVFQTDSLSQVIADLDVIAVTRIQKERFANEKEYEKFAGSYVVDSQLMALAKINSIVIHPLPRVDEIAIEVDNDSRAKYFEQVKNGVAVRMALIELLLDK